MKKLIALVLALVMCFALCACGQSAAPAATDKVFKLQPVALLRPQQNPQQNPQPTLQLTPQQSSTPR